MYRGILSSFHLFSHEGVLKTSILILDFLKKFVDSWKPSVEWGPKNAKKREEWVKNEADYQMERLFEKHD